MQPASVPEATVQQQEVWAQQCRQVAGSAQSTCARLVWTTGRAAGWAVHIARIETERTVDLGQRQSALASKSRTVPSVDQDEPSAKPVGNSQSVLLCGKRGRHELTRMPPT